MTASKYIVDIIGNVVASIRTGETPYYLYGHPIEVVNTLSEWTKSPTLKMKKFPLIVLFQDFEEQKGKHQSINSSVSLNMVICMNTLPSYKSHDRYDATFKTVLYPLYDLFISKLATCGYFHNASESLISHVKIDRVFWGKSGLNGNTANAFNDYIDAIEIKNLDLDILNQFKNC
jgi:hypothetical protein